MLLNLFEEKKNQILEEFAACKTQESTYQKIMELGRCLKPIDAKFKTEANRVHGCQSVMYLNATEQNGKIYFEASSDALISAGLAAILVKVYSGLSAEEILKADSSFLNILGLSKSLSPNRANGLYSILLKIKQQAICFLIPK